VAAGCVGNARAIRLKRGWVEPSVLWTLTVAYSGGHKSPAYAAAVDPLMELQMDVLDAHREKLEQYREDLAEWSDRTKSERGRKPDAPPEPRTFVTSDATIEALGELLQDNPHGLLQARDEQDAWFKSFTRYKGKGGGTDRPQWLELHRAGTLRIDRLTRERRRLAVRRAAVSLTGTIQPGVLREALDLDALQSGLGARLLLVMPPDRRRVWTEAELPEDLVERYRGLLGSLLNLALKDEGKRLPHILELSPPAKRLWVEFYNSWGETQFAAEGEQRAAFAKIEAYAARLMLLHHVVAHVASKTNDITPVTEASARAGIGLARWFAAEATRIYAMLRETEEQRQARRLVEWVAAQGGRVTARDLQRANSRRWPTSDLAEGALQGLVDAGLGRWEEGPVPDGGGRRPRWFVLFNPTPDVSDNRPGDVRDDDEGLSDDRPDNRPEPPPSGPAGSCPSPNPVEACGETPVSVGERSSETSDVGQEKGAAEQETPANRSSGASVGQEVLVRSEVVNVPPYQLIDNPADIQKVVQALDESEIVGVDTETTGLEPRTDRLRLLSLRVDKDVYLVDLFAITPQALGPVLALLHDRVVVGHNLAFDLSFMARIGFTPGVVCDTMLKSQLLHGTWQEKGFHSLGQLARRELGRTLDKQLQRSDWSGELTPEQLAYAAADVAVLAPLYELLRKKITDAGMENVVEIENRALPAMAWLSQAGLQLDQAAWEAQARSAAQEAEALAVRLNEAAPPRPEGKRSRTKRTRGKQDNSTWNWRSVPQVKEVFALVGVKLKSTDDDALAGVDHPLADLLRKYRSAAKRANTYGLGWLEHVAADGRIYPGWIQIGADSGRMACSDPNAQNLPRDVRYRRCFKAPEGRVLVKADYSQVELRIAAKLSGDRAMLEAYGRGDDLHILTAQRVLGVEQVTEEHRQLAKALNFGLLYGMQAQGFRQYAKSQYGLGLTPRQAEQYRRAFFKSYPGLETWHRQVKRQHAAETRTLAGRRRLLDAKTSDTLRLNSPVQGTGADGLKLALAFLWERRDQCPGAFPVLAVHDELVVEADVGQADAVAGWLKQAMFDGMAPLINPIPVEIKVAVGTTWAGE
jgi:DNA polymerase-1